MSRYRIFYRHLILWSLLSILLASLPPDKSHAQDVKAVQFSLNQLGYSERVLRGPLTQIRYYFSLPTNWEIQNGGYLELNLELGVGQHENYAPAVLETRLNGEILYTVQLTRTESIQTQVSIPAASLHTIYANTLQFELQVNAECERARLTTAIVKSSSLIYLPYSEKPLNIDLALYPEPLYYTSSFGTRPIHLLLPDQPGEADIQAAAAIVSRLGRLMGNALTISVTLASEVQPASSYAEHMFIIGSPEHMPLLRTLDLPISPANRQLALQSTMPAEIAPGETFSYTLHVTNTEQQARSLFVEDQLPSGTTWLSCSGECQQNTPGLLRWQIGNLAAGAEISTVVHLSLDGQALPDKPIEHTATLFDNNGTPLNVNTLSTAVTPTPDHSLTVSGQPKGNYFFVHAGRGVPETDGVVQEVLSPWNPRSALLVITGLDEQALFKAAQALSSETHFPGMQGNYALIQTIQPVSSTLALADDELAFQALGYDDVAIRGYQASGAEYVFELPWGWSLTREAHATIYFAHGFSDLAQSPALEVQLNDIPIGSVLLDKTNAVNASLTVPLPYTPLVFGSNTLRLLVSYNPDRCLNSSDNQPWLTVFKNSFLYLPRQSKNISLDLNNFPLPFSRRSDLQDLVMVLSARPVITEIEGILRLSARLGSAARGTSFMPQVVLGTESPAPSWPGSNLIVVGRPTTNAYIAQWNDILPQSFYTGTDEIRQQLDDVVYRLDAQTSLGFVQLMPAPWDQKQAILILTGTTDEGVQWAINAVTDKAPAWNLAGNLALAQGRNVRSIDTTQRTTREMVELIATALPIMTPQSTVTPQPTETLPSVSTPTPSPAETATITAIVTRSSHEQTAPPQVRPFWLIPLLIVSVLAVIGASVIMIWKSRSR